MGLSSRQTALLAAVVLYAVGAWFHIPYGGGHIYSDIPTVFQNRECGGSCLSIPYVNGFVEYPVIVSLFMYLMGLGGSLLTNNILLGYYWLSVLVLAVPTLLLVDETVRISAIVGSDGRRVLRYLVLTPTFVFVLLVNWYSIGVYFAIFGLRKLLEGNTRFSGFLVGISAASNLVTAAPGIGMMLSLRNPRDMLRFAATAGLTFLAINGPFILLNPQLFQQFWAFHSNWYIEGSWMLALLPSSSDLRHYLFPATLIALLLAIFWLRKKVVVNRPIFLSWMSTSAFLFSTYVAPPQTNLMLLPFFALLPITKRYREFFLFDLVNALVIVVGFSQPLWFLGITYKIDMFSYSSIVQWMAIARSLWVGKLLFWDGFSGEVERRVLRRAIGEKREEHPLLLEESTVQLRSKSSEVHP